MADISVDDGYLFYMPYMGKPTPKPYWKAFMVVAALAEHIGFENDDPESDQFYLLDEDKKLLGIQMIEPVDDNGAPVERAISFAKTLLDEEDVQDIIHECQDMREQFGFNNEMDKQEFFNVLSSGLTDKEMNETFKDYDNVFFLGDPEELEDED